MINDHNENRFEVKYIKLDFIVLGFKEGLRKSIQR